MENLQWSLNPNILPDLTGNRAGLLSTLDKGDQTDHTEKVSVPDTTTKNPIKHISKDCSIKPIHTLFTNLQQALPIYTINIVENL